MFGSSSSSHFPDNPSTTQSHNEPTDNSPSSSFSGFEINMGGSGTSSAHPTQVTVAWGMSTSSSHGFDIDEVDHTPQSESQNNSNSSAFTAPSNGGFEEGLNQWRSEDTTKSWGNTQTQPSWYATSYYGSMSNGQNAVTMMESSGDTNTDGSNVPVTTTRGNDRISARTNGSDDPAPTTSSVNEQSVTVANDNQPTHATNVSHGGTTASASMNHVHTTSFKPSITELHTDGGPSIINDDTITDTVADLGISGHAHPLITIVCMIVVFFTLV